MSKDQAKSDIRNLTAQAIAITPATLLPDLAESEGMSGVPQWHDYERNIWSLGEQIRQTLLKYKALQKDTELQQLYLRVCLNRKAKRGRQSFIMLFGHKYSQGYASQLLTQIDDEFVCGHVILSLNKMHAIGFASVIEDYTKHRITWIRNEAKKYIAKYG